MHFSIFFLQNGIVFPSCKLEIDLQFTDPHICDPENFLLSKNAMTILRYDIDLLTKLLLSEHQTYIEQKTLPDEFAFFYHSTVSITGR